jgi:uncharacterized protein (DUF2126 family)
MTAYEDVPKLIVAESALPENLDPLQADLSKPTERARLARCCSRVSNDRWGSCCVEGDRARGAASTDWTSSPWPLRRASLCARRRFALRGCGYRCRRCRTCCRRTDVETAIDPFGRAARLPGTEAHTVTATGRKAHRGTVAPREVVKTALCIEMRDGHVFVFMPPLKRLEDYVVLLAAVERAAARVGRAVAIEGYTPPRDPRVTVLNVTPDPGVIEVNIHPASTWDEFIATTQTLYEEARQSRLGTEKFMLDGRHAGTGGGNHVTLGGATPEDSPLLVVLICCEASLPIGKTTLRCLTCFRACSSARRAKRRAWTRRATIASTSSRSHSSS